MVADDIQLMNILKGKRMKLTTKTASYVGVLQRINPNKTVILADVVSVSNGCRLSGTKMFFGRDVVNVEFIDGDRDHGNGQQNKPEDHLIVEDFQPYKDPISIYDDEDEEEHINIEVIDEFHEKFGPAVMHIKKQRVIGVGIDGINVYKHGRLSWLQIATKNKVYLFDILLLGHRAFKNGLSMILESNHILKVIHDCRAIAGCLIAQFGIKVTNIFDTQVADVMCFYSETGGYMPDRVSTLHEVVSLHLTVPSSHLSSLQMKSQITKEEREVWHKRPCPVPLLKVMALSVFHLQPLRLVLLDTLMSDYMALVDSYLSSSHYEPDELEHISMDSVLQLPKELRKLEEMRCERREWAASHYPVTEQGLLSRFNPRPLFPSKPPPTKGDSLKDEDTSTSATLSSAQVDQPPMSPANPTDASSPKSVDVLASPDPGSEDAIPQFGTSLSIPLSVHPLPTPTESLMDTVGRGRLLGKEQSSFPPWPSIGRGFFLQIPSSQIPRKSAREMESSRPTTASPQDAKPPPDSSYSDLISTQSGIAATPLSHSSSLSKSFSSFRC